MQSSRNRQSLRNFMLETHNGNLLEAVIVLEI